MRLRRRKAEVDVLLVCTGNLCRSPMAEVILRSMRPDLVIASAGTAAVDGTPWHPFTIEALQEAGYDFQPGVARRLRRADVRSAKLILTAEGAHRSVAIRLDPTAEDRTFTLLEAARLARIRPDVPVTIDGLVAELQARMSNERTEHDDDLPDPIYGGLSKFLACEKSIGESLDVLF